LTPYSTQEFGQHVLDTGARHDAGGEGRFFDDHRRFGQHRLDIEGLQLAAVEHAEINKSASGAREKRWQKSSLPPV
jgi:hypothetical protein